MKERKGRNYGTNKVVNISNNNNNIFYNYFYHYISMIGNGTV